MLTLKTPGAVTSYKETTRITAGQPSLFADSCEKSQWRIKNVLNPRNIYTKVTSVFVMALAIGTAAVAKTHSDPAFSNIKIKNFGKMDDRFYRGAQPGESDYKDLKTLGINTIIDLN